MKIHKEHSLKLGITGIELLLCIYIYIDILFAQRPYFRYSISSNNLIDTERSRQSKSQAK